MSSPDCGGPWDSLVRRLDAIELKLGNRRRKLIQINTREEANGSVVSLPPFQSRRDAVCRLLYKGAVTTSISSSGLFLRGPEGGDHPVDLAGLTTNREDGRDCHITVGMSQSVSTAASTSEPFPSSASRKRDSTHFVSRGSASLSKRRRVSRLSVFTVDLRQRMSGNIRPLWQSVDLACCHRAALEIEGETQHLQKTLNQTVVRISSLLSMMNLECRESGASLHNPYPPQLSSTQQQQQLSSHSLSESLLPSPFIHPSIVYPSLSHQVAYPSPPQLHQSPFHDKHAVAMYTQQQSATSSLSSLQHYASTMVSRHPTAHCGLATSFGSHDVPIYFPPHRPTLGIQYQHYPPATLSPEQQPLVSSSPRPSGPPLLVSQLLASPSVPPSAEQHSTESTVQRYTQAPQHPQPPIMHARGGMANAFIQQSPPQFYPPQQPASHFPFHHAQYNLTPAHVAKQPQQQLRPPYQQHSASNPQFRPP